MKSRGAAGIEYVVIAVLIGISGILIYKSLGKKYSCKLSQATGLFTLNGEKAGAVDHCDDESGGAQASNSPSPSGGNSGSAGPTSSVTCVGGVCSGANKCFVAGTLVLTEHGFLPIESLEAGTRVWARDDDGDSSDWKPIEQTFSSISASLVELRVASRGEDADELIEVTPNHLMHVEGRGWVEARSLDPARDLLLDSNGDVLAIHSIAARDAHVPVFNLIVADFHTYFVGTHGLWVHNGPGLRTWITVSTAAGPMEVFVVEKNRDGTYEIEYRDAAGHRYSGTIGKERRLGRGYSLIHTYPSRPVPRFTGDHIGTLPVTNAPPHPGPTRIGDHIQIYTPSQPQRHLPGASSFRQDTLNVAADVGSTVVGTRLHNGIQDNPRGYDVAVRYRPGYATTDTNLSHAELLRSGLPNPTPGPGSSSTVYFDPATHGAPLYYRGAPIPGEMLGDMFDDPSARARNKPPQVTYAHEMTHGYTNTYGYDDQRSHGPYPQVHEQQTTGLGPFSQVPVSENSYRSEANLPRRQYYTSPDEQYPPVQYQPNEYFSPPVLRRRGEPEPSLSDMCGFER